MCNRRDIDIDNFHQSTASFREYEEKCLRIDVHQTNDVSLIFNTCNDESLLTNLQELVLDTLNVGDIKAFVPSKKDELTTSQRRFLMKLKLVLLSNDPDAFDPNCERFVDDLVNFLCEQVYLDDGLEMSVRPCQLRLTIGNQQFAATADKEGRRGQELIWLLQEDKHRGSTSYKHGDLQLACAMIAAIQRNYFRFETIKPKERIVMHRFPKHGFSLANPTERKEILKYMSVLQREALSII
ncbi:uncharacterized protein BX664DRAFT_362460 [Halteromyces radiatus]|uniref:uncharacterized protein n=1 Tax=Halteromyces radiatus TaxID=101107 RepID=UPI00221F1950|nr:uncharacterized protein BX664DRAFT_362460 [Halteromyces radiatus]KAI8078918.1 hypothetical protein BX664DRAFT_362460 [Halteromyces radiatus]